MGELVACYCPWKHHSLMFEELKYFNQLLSAGSTGPFGLANPSLGVKEKKPILRQWSLSGLKSSRSQALFLCLGAGTHRSDWERSSQLSQRQLDCFREPNQPRSANGRQRNNYINYYQTQLQIAPLVSPSTSQKAGKSSKSSTSKVTGKNEKYQPLL